MAHDLQDPSKTAHLNEILARYRSDASLQAQHATVYAWFAANGYDVPKSLLDPPAERPDVEGYLASIKGNHFSAALTDAEKANVEEYANAWQMNADIRNEFRSFASYASYMKFKERGQLGRH